MNLLTQTQIEQLLENGSDKNIGKDLIPVVKLFIPGISAVWLLTELLDEDMAFGLCDLGIGTPKLCYVSLAELQSINIFGATVECDESFSTKYPVSVFEKAAKTKGHIVEDHKELNKIALKQ